MEIKQLKKENGNLKQIININSLHLDDVQQYSRRDHSYLRNREIKVQSRLRRKSDSRNRRARF